MGAVGRWLFRQFELDELSSLDKCLHRKQKDSESLYSTATLGAPLMLQLISEGTSERGDVGKASESPLVVS